MQNDWMKDEALKHIEPHKLEFLQVLLFESNSIKKEQMLPFLMAVTKRGQEQHISFSDQEMDAIISVLRKYATSQEIQKMEKIIALRNRKF